jgi:hypothetical protein
MQFGQNIIFKDSISNKTQLLNINANSSIFAVNDRDMRYAIIMVQL